MPRTELRSGAGSRAEIKKRRFISKCLLQLLERDIDYSKMRG